LWRGLIAYVLAVAVQVPFIDQTFYTGPLVKTLGGTDISWVVGGVAGVVFYLIALRTPTHGETANLDPGPLGSTALDAPT
jgi:NCS1 family nucleobase:cation symporter-1